MHRGSTVFFYSVFITYNLEDSKKMPWLNSIKLSSVRFWYESPQTNFSDRYSTSASDSLSKWVHLEERRLEEVCFGTTQDNYTKEKSSLYNCPW